LPSFARAILLAVAFVGSKSNESKQVLQKSLHSTMLLFYVITSSLFNSAYAFNLPVKSTVRAPTPIAAKSICTFDSSDFAGKQGDWPYTAADLNRLDNSIDSNFYAEPRFVTHIDDMAIELLTNYYREEFSSMNKKGPLDILDLCSSWISHLPSDIRYGRVAGVGMNQKELEANKQLTEFHVQDMNEQPTLSLFEDNSFDVICNVVSVDYLTKPQEIFREMHRILRPGGVSLMSFSNRCFPSKAVAMWLQADDIGRLTIVASYYHYAAEWESIEALDLKEKQATPERPSAGEVFKNPASLTAWMNVAAAVAKNNSGDPMFVVKGVK
jgi:ubiquinone/menaquinone biosynthesis C-methylase UbiE